MERLAAMSKKHAYFTGSAAGAVIGILSLFVGWTLFRDVWGDVVAVAFCSSIVFIALEAVIQSRLCDEEQAFALTNGTYTSLVPVWAPWLAHRLPSSVSAGSGSYALVVLTAAVVVGALALLALRLHFTLADIRRLSAKRR